MQIPTKKQIEADASDRALIWDSMQMIFMDTEVDFKSIAKACAASKYSVLELKEILLYEVFPAPRFNLLRPTGGQWEGFAANWLKKRILKKQTYNKLFQPRILRKYTLDSWGKLEPLIISQRSSSKI